MSRQEDFIEAAYNNDRESSKQEQQFFVAGCEHGYQYAIEKACEWLRTHLGAPKGIPQAKAYEDAMNELISEFCKGMEE